MVKCGATSLQTLTSTPAFNPRPMPVEPPGDIGSSATSCCLTLCDVISVWPAMTFAVSLKVTSPTEYPVGTTLSRNSATVCRNLSNLVAWQHMTDESNNVILTKNMYHLKGNNILLSCLFCPAAEKLPH